MTLVDTPIVQPVEHRESEVGTTTLQAKLGEEHSIGVSPSNAEQVHKKTGIRTNRTHIVRTTASSSDENSEPDQPETSALTQKPGSSVIPLH